MTLLETPLFAEHKKSGGKLVDFGGWNMPLHYGSQVEEHHCVRRDVGMFDVSHMTIVDVLGTQAKEFLQYLLANDVAKLDQVGKALYTAMLNLQGGVLDDLIVYRLPEGFRLVVNCATRVKDLTWINQQAAAFAITVTERTDLAIIAVQGPAARSRVAELLDADALEKLPVFHASIIERDASQWLVARTGYTGEDGYEIILPAVRAENFWRSLHLVGVTPCGLGARDTLRLEAGMNLYGHEMDDTISPLIANMGWTVAWSPAERNFIGRAPIQKEKETGVTHKLVGLMMTAKAVLRAGQKVISEDLTEGVVTSGSYSPTLGHSIALARVPMHTGNSCTVEIRGKSIAVEVTKPCFVRNGKRVV